MSLAPSNNPSVETIPPVRPASPEPKAIGSGEGTASLVFSVLAPASMLLTAPLSLLAALFTRPSQGLGPMDWVAPLVLWSYPVLFGLLAVALGLVSLRVFVRGSNGWLTGAVALWLCGAHAVVGLVLVLMNGDLMIVF